SLVDSDSIDVARRIESADARAEVMLPVDLVVADSLDHPTIVETIAQGDVPDTLMALDIGPETIEQYATKIAGAKMVFWNGPMGVFEKQEFAKGTMAMAKAVAEAK